MEAIKTERGRVPAGKHRTRPEAALSGHDFMLAEERGGWLRRAAEATALVLTMSGVLPVTAANALILLLDPIPGWAFVAGLCALMLAGAAWVWRSL